MREREQEREREKAREREREREKERERERMLESESRLVSHGQSRPCPLVSHDKLYNGLDCILGSRPTHTRLPADTHTTVRSG